MIKLIDFTQNDHPFGTVQGKETFRKLSDYVDQHPSQVIFGISLKGIETTDASFPRESVVSLAKQYRGEKGFYLQDFKTRDLIENWDYAAKAKDQPLFIWSKDNYEVIGPEVTTPTKEILDYISKNKAVTTSKVAEAFKTSAQSASARLKKLADQGFLMRKKDTADTGGIEFVYEAIK